MMRKNAYQREELIQSGHGMLFGESFARLPLPPMLMFDRIVEINKEGGAYGNGEAKAVLEIDPSLWFFESHFETDPVMPGCLGLDAVWQLTGFFLAWSGHPGKGRALGVGEVKFTGQILPTSKEVTYHVQIKRVLVRKLVLAIADGTVSVDGRQVYTASGLKVGMFESTDDF
ncbi:MAG TPA: 3-hydroxyacyl-[acyl-carrier-protein] dehydratase FabA [Kiritimatiellia bacterium]|nr:3-hydroxyacyl-[acyl-carrier-protein] dehydratase FabA [Kiritimatiellia bacterium]